MTTITQPVQVGQIGAGDKFWLTTFSVTASAAANTVFTGTLTPYGIDDGTTFTAFQIPSGIRYNLVDLYISSAPSTDGQLAFYIGGTKQGENFFLSSIALSTSGGSRSKPSQPIILEAGATFTVKLTLLVAAPSTAYSQYLILHFLAVPT